MTNQQSILTQPQDTLEPRQSVISHAGLDVASFYLAPALLLLSSLLYVFDGNGMNDGVAGGFVQCIAFILFIFPALTLTSISANKLPVFSVVLRILLVFGCFGGFAFGLDSILNATQPGAYSLMEMDATIGGLMAATGGIWPIGMGALGIVLGVKNVLPKLPAILLVVAGFSFPFGRIPDIAAIYFITDMLLIVSLALAVSSVKKPNASSA